ncbi:MAG: type II toxin-antitoxin system RelE/ParE family toxin [Desulfovibrio sp.]|uniref:type II toxin-antitoxin system RelE/ParE family toxin n=1 Tax=Desulfovibrio sp. 7SRBS1 TaxID=3378064 RepID=UPI003B3DE0A2
MRKVRLTHAAKGHLKAIWRYSFETWGEGKADAYLTEIEAKLNLLADNPNLGRNRPRIKTNYYSIKINRHIVFYLFDDEHIDVIGVLHEKMDISTWL